MTSNPAIKDFAIALEKWVEGDDEKQLLLKWLLSRCESRGFKGPGKSSKISDPRANRYLIERRSIEDLNIAKAVMRAMQGYNPHLPTGGWIRGGPIWPKAYGDIWPKAYGS